MARTTTLQAKASAKRLAAGLIDSATTLWVICANKTSRVARKISPEPTSSPRAKQLLTSINSKVARLRNKKKDKNGKEKCEYGIWQRSILMGDKCEPLDFPGVIYYDNDGKQLDELPVRSLQGSPLPGYLTNSARRRGETIDSRL